MLINEMWDAITTLFSQRKKKKEISFYNHKNKEKFLKNSWQYEGPWIQSHGNSFSTKGN